MKIPKHKFQIIKSFLKTGYSPMTHFLNPILWPNFKCAPAAGDIQSKKNTHTHTQEKKRGPKCQQQTKIIMSFVCQHNTRGQNSQLVFLLFPENNPKILTIFKHILHLMSRWFNTNSFSKDNEADHCFRSTAAHKLSN